MLAAKLLITAAVLWLVLRKIDFATVLAHLHNLQILPLAAATLLLVLMLVLTVWRWQLTLAAQGARPPFSRLFRYLWSATFVGQALPSTIGTDAARTWLAWRGGLPMRLCVSSVATERMSMLLGLAMLLAGVEPLTLTRFDWGYFRYVPPAVLALFLIGLAMMMSADRWTRRLPRWTVLRAIEFLATDARAVFLNPRCSLPLCALAIVSNFNFALILWWIGRALGIETTILDCTVMMSISIFAVLPPVSIGGWGVREGALVVLFGLVGMPASEAATLSIVYGLLNIVVALPGGGFWLLDSANHKSAARSRKPEDGALRTASISDF